VLRYPAVLDGVLLHWGDAIFLEAGMAAALIAAATMLPVMSRRARKR